MPSFQTAYDTKHVSDARFITAAVVSAMRAMHPILQMNLAG